MSLSKNLDYSKSIIYKIACKDDDVNDFYIGSTINLNKRRFRHKSCCNTSTCHQYNYKVYQFIRENGGWDNWEIKTIENYPCNSKDELRKREQHYIKELQPTLNVYIAIIEDKKEYIKNYMTKYRQENPEKLKEIREKRKDKTKEYNKQYYATVSKGMTIDCPCGKSVFPYRLEKHLQSKYHQTHSPNNE